MNKDFLLSLAVSEKRALIAELRQSINLDRSIARSAKVLAKAEKAQARADKKNARIAALDFLDLVVENPSVYTRQRVAAGLLTLPDLHLHLEMQDDRRSARFIAHTATGRAWRDASLAALLSLPSG